MKSFLIFIVGFGAGVLATILIAYLIVVTDEPNDGLIGLSKFSQKGECIPVKNELKVFQVVEPNMALATSGGLPDEEIIVLLINYDSMFYYDNQRVKIPSKKCARQIGAYQYSKYPGMDKTVPAVVIE
ncbi:MAG: hypothetical protein KF829_06500 [Ferruginibacter sp.]|nr:hypothetical protein [Ferruginibacter sp.]